MRSNSPATDRVDVLVVGAGPTGLTLAIDLLRWGLTVRLVDASPGPQEGSRGFGIKPRTLEVFDDLGIAARVVAADGDAPSVVLHLGGTLLGEMTPALDPPAPARPYPNSVSLPQWRTEQILREQLERCGGRVEFGTALAGFADEGPLVTARLSDGTVVTASYLVGCDGGRSTVRRTLGIGFSGSTDEDARAALADLEVAGLPSHAVHLWVGGGTMLALRPYREGQPWQVIASIEPGEEASLPWLQQAVTTRSGMAAIRLSRPRWLSVWRYNLRLADHYRAGRVFLAGDAAHVHSPFGAFGMNTGVQDAYNLGWKLGLVLRGAHPSLLDSYETERRPVGRAILDDSDQRLAAATAPPRLLRPLLPYLARPFLRRMNRRGRTDQPRYPSSPLTVPASGRRRLRPGDSAPDGVGRTPGGEPVRLFDLFRGPHFTLLAFSAPVPEPRPCVRCVQVGRDIVDVDHTIRHAYPRCRYALVRPDNYVAALTDELGEVTTVLERVLSGC